jgi:hypothetical protein
MALALGMVVAGMGGVSLAPSGSLYPILIAWSLVAAGQALFWTLHTSLWMAALPDSARVDVQGWVGAISAILMAVMAPVLAGLITHLPRISNGTWTALAALGLVLLLAERRRIGSLSRL